MAAQHLLDALEVRGGWDEHAARAHHRLGDKRCHRPRPFRHDQRLQVVRELLGERLVGQARLRLPQAVRRGRVANHRQRQVEVRMQAGKPRQARRHHADAVVAALARDDLLLLRPSEHVVVEPHQLHVRVVGVGSGAAEEDLGHPGRSQREQPLGEQRRRVGPHRRERVVVAEALGVRAQCLGQLDAAVADVDAPQARHRVDVARAVEVRDARAAALHDHARRPGAFVLVELRERMEDVAPVVLLDRRRHHEIGHRLPPSAPVRQPHICARGVMPQAMPARRAPSRRAATRHPGGRRRSSAPSSPRSRRAGLPCRCRCP